MIGEYGHVSLIRLNSLSLASSDLCSFSTFGSFYILGFQNAIQMKIMSTFSACFATKHAQRTALTVVTGTYGNAENVSMVHGIISVTEIADSVKHRPAIRTTEPVFQTVLMGITSIIAQFHVCILVVKVASVKLANVLTVKLDFGETIARVSVVPVVKKLTETTHVSRIIVIVFLHLVKMDFITPTALEYVTQPVY